MQVSDAVIAHPETRTALRAVLKAWLPLSEAVLGMAVEHLPSPAAAAPLRLQRLLPPQQIHLAGAELPADVQQVGPACGAARRCAAGWPCMRSCPQMCSRLALHAVLHMMGVDRQTCNLNSSLLRGVSAGQVGTVEATASWANAESCAVGGLTWLEAWLQGLDACQEGLGSCNISPEAPVVVYVSKMVAVPAVALPR